MEKQIEYRKFAKVLYILASITYWVSLIGLGFMGLLMIGSLFIQESIIVLLLNSIDPAQLHFDQGTFRFSIDWSLVVPKELLVFLRVGLFNVLIQMGVYFFIALEFRNLMRHLMTELPFTEITVKYLKYLGIGIIISSFLVLLSSSSFTYLFMDSETVKQILGAGVTDMGTNITLFDKTSMLAGLVVLLLSRIFSYGVELQEEVDQTI